MAIVYSGAALASYGRQAGGVIEYEWVPDPIVFSEKVLHVRDELADRSVPLAISRGIIARDVEENFEGEHDPQGQPWAPWSEGEDRFDPVTNRWIKGGFGRGYANNLPAGHSGKILNWRGILKDAATNEANYVQVSGQAVTDDSLFFNTNGLPPYWVYHEQPSGANTGNIPQRSFLGLSDEGAILVAEEFARWFDDIIQDAAVTEAFTTSRGRTFRRRSSDLGIVLPSRANKIALTTLFPPSFRRLQFCTRATRRPHEGFAEREITTIKARTNISKPNVFTPHINKNLCCINVVSRVILNISKNNGAFKSSKQLECIGQRKCKVRESSNNIRMIL